MAESGYCQICGSKLMLKYLENEGEIPFCEKCNAFRFRMYNVAMSAIVYHPDRNKIALIQQYGNKNNILVAGYVNIGESVEETVKREIKEELGLNVRLMTYNESSYYEPSNTLMVNFACVVDSDDLSKTNDEIDAIHWYSIEDAKKNILKNSLAEQFLLHWLKKHQE